MRWPPLYIVLLIILFCLYFTGCSGCSRSGLKETAEKRQYDNPRRSTSSRESYNPENIRIPTKPIKQGLSLSGLFQQNKDAVFLVYTSTGTQGYQGSGFFINPGGIGISNYHVFEGTSQGLEIIELSNGRKLKIERIIKKDKENDFIIFQVRNSGSLDYLPIANNLPKIGEDVFAIGNPQGLEHTLSTGIISGFRENNKFLQTTTEITHGSSGGPLMNMKGEVIGITTSGIGEANLNFAINIQKLNLALKIER